MTYQEPEGDRETQTNYEALLESARELFSERGFSDVGIREIASKAGVTIGTLYYYAPSKEELFLRLLIDSYERATQRLRSAVDQADGAVDKLKVLVAEHITNEVQGQEVWSLAKAERAILNQENQLKLQLARDGFENIWREVIELGMSEGTFTNKHPTIVRISMIKICNGVADWFREDGPSSLKEVCSIIASQALALVQMDKESES